MDMMSPGEFGLGVMVMEARFSWVISSSLSAREEMGLGSCAMDGEKSVTDRL